MASKSARKRRKRRPPPRSAAATPDLDAAAEVPPTEAAAPRAGARLGRGAELEPPPAPWGSFPLVEISVLLGIVMLIIGFFFVTGSRGPILIATGLVLGSIGGLELSIREHFAGFRSHTMVLAGVPALIVLGALFYAGPDGLPQLARAGIGVAVFAVAAALLSRVFAHRSGGARYRFKPLRGRGR